MGVATLSTTGTTSLPAGPSLQLSWSDDVLHLWAIDVDQAAPLAQVQIIRLIDRHGGHRLTGAAMPGRLVIELPAPLGTTTVAALRFSLQTIDDLRFLTERPAATTGPAAGGSLRWFLDLADLARTAVRAGRIRPTLTGASSALTARWVAVRDPFLDDALDALGRQQPAACLAGDPGTMFDRLVDAVARRHLADTAWRPPPPRHARGTDYRAAQSAFRALGSSTGAVLYRIEDLPALHQLARQFDAELHRARGERVLAAQVRLTLPDDRNELWQLSIEIVDVDQPERWCTAADVHESNIVATDLVDPRSTPARLLDLIDTAAQQLAAASPQLLSLRTEPARSILMEIDEVETFLADTLGRLEEMGITVLGPEQLIRVKAGVRGEATPRMDAGAGAGGRFGATALVHWDTIVDDSPVDEAQLERAAATGASLMHVNGRWVRLDPKQIRHTLARLQRERDERSELDVAGLLRLAAESTAARNPAGPGSGGPGSGSPGSGSPGSGDTAVGGTGWAGELLAGLPDERLVETVEPASFTGTLRHYQRRGLSWMNFLTRLGLGGCLADDMGLGKTATALAHLTDRPGPHLVVCPLSVVHNWSAEAARFTPHLTVMIHHGGERVRSSDSSSPDPLQFDGFDAGGFDAGGASLAAADIVVTTYGLLARDVELLREIPWNTIVLDEAQQIKNHLTRAAKAVRQIPAHQRFALTGTPVENHLGELWAILDAVNPGLLGSAKAFNDRFVKPIQRDQDPDATSALRALTQPFVLRRTKADKSLLPELPDKLEQIAWATLTREQATMYQAVVDQLIDDAQAASGMKRRGLVLAALTRLKQICNHPAHAAGDGSRLAGRSGKLIRFDEIIDDLLLADERALVFTQFREMGLLLQRHLRERAIPEHIREECGDVFAETVPFLHGGVTRTGRDKMVARFQAGEGPPLLIVSLKAGGTGLNLTAASQVVHYDRWWNPAVEDQATDRAWRLGQQKSVLVHKLVCEGTLEERIGELIDDKKRLAASVLGTGEQWLTELSTDDLRTLVALAPGASGSGRGSTSGSGGRTSR